MKAVVTRTVDAWPLGVRCENRRSVNWNWHIVISTSTQAFLARIRRHGHCCMRDTHCHRECTGLPSLLALTHSGAENARATRNTLSFSSQLCCEGGHSRLRISQLRCILLLPEQEVFDVCFEELDLGLLFADCFAVRLLKCHDLGG